MRNAFRGCLADSYATTFTSGPLASTCLRRRPLPHDHEPTNPTVSPPSIRYKNHFTLTQVATDIASATTHYML